MQAESTLEVSWDGEVIPDVVRVAGSTEYRNAVVIERSLTEDSSLKAWMDFVIILSMRQELHDASQVSKDISIQERGESSEVTHRVLRGCKPLEYSAHAARRNPPAPVTPDSVERLVVQYDGVEMV